MALSSSVVLYLLLVTFAVSQDPKLPQRSEPDNATTEEIPGCPSRCTCFRTTVRCLFQSMDVVPTVPHITTVLDLRFNNLKEIRPGAFRNLHNLHTLLLNNNQLTTIRNGSFEGLTQLRYLYLYKNRISTIDVGAFRELTSLEQLYLHYNDLEFIDPGTFSILTSLERLFLHNNKLKHIQEDTLSGLKSLVRLQLDSNSLVCDCEMIWLSDMLKDGHLQAAVTCDQPSSMAGKQFSQVINDLNCRKPELTVRPRDVEISSGGTAYFTCRAEGDPTPVIVWFRNNKEINTNRLTRTSNSPSRNDNSPSRYSILEDGTLMIENTRESDEGLYECVARNPLGETKAEGVELRYLDSNDKVRAAVRPNIAQKPSDLSLGEGETATLECVASGHPQPTITWLRNDLALPLGDPRLRVDRVDGTLTIRELQTTDRGIYRCMASNELGTVSEFARLEVFGAPQFIKRPQDQKVVQGHAAFLSCDVIGEPLPIIHWNKDGKRLTSSDSGRVDINPSGTTLTIGLVEDQDAGVYECVAESAGGKRTASARLTIASQAPPVIRRPPRDVEAPIGTTANFECHVSGDPQPTVRWHRGDQSAITLTTSTKYDVTHDGSALAVRNINRADDGEYECIAQNSAGMVRAIARLTVWDTHFSSLSTRHINDTVSEAARRVNLAVDGTRRSLFGVGQQSSNRPRLPGDQSAVRTADDLMRLVRYPPSQAISLARSAEIFEQTLETLLAQVNDGHQYRLNSSMVVSYEELLTPTQLALVASLSGCQEHRRIVKCDDMCFHLKYRTMDGTCNNLHDPMFGASLAPLLRLLPARYENNFNMPIGWNLEKTYNGVRLPSARTVSVGIISAPRITADDTYSHMLMQWGQFIDHDIDFVPTAVSHARFSDGRFCNETCQSSGPCFAIPVDENDPRIRSNPRRGRCIGFVRSSAMCGSGATSVFFDNVIQRQQMNALTSYIDASMIYGSSEDDARNLRDFTTGRGLLRTSPPTGSTQKALLPPNQGEPVDCQMDATTSHVPCFQAGDHRANEQLGLLSMHTLWMREHNRLAGELLSLNPHWDSDTVYYEARKIVGAVVQHITYAHWLPKVLGEAGMRLIGPYKGYDPTVDSSVANEFAAAAFRFGHTLIQPILARLNESYRPISAGNLPLHKAFFAPFRLVDEGGVDPIVRGLIGLPAKRHRPGELLNAELTEKLFTLAHDVANDLAAFNIQRGRDHGLRSYADYRKHCGLASATDTSSSSFDMFRNEIRNEEVRRKLRQLYGHPDNVDLFVGGVAEDPIDGARVGPTFMCIIADQFKRLRDGDRFWYENPGVFSPSQLNELLQASLTRIICDNSDNIRQVPPDVFMFQHDLPEGQLPCDVIPRVDVKVWAQCCQECSRTGDFRSITQHFRTRRSADQSFSEQRPLADVAKQIDDIMLNDEGDVKPASSFTLSLSSATVLEEAMHMSQKMMDIVDSRIEGMEDVMKDLQETVKKLGNKLSKLEKTMTTPSGRTKKPAVMETTTLAPCLNDKGQVKNHGANWKENDCRQCQCKNGTVECTVETCQIPECVAPAKVSGRCCPVCPA